MNGRAVLGPTQLCFGYRMEIPQTAAGTQHCILYPADVVCLCFSFEQSGEKLTFLKDSSGGEERRIPQCVFK